VNAGITRREIIGGAAAESLRVHCRVAAAARPAPSLFGDLALADHYGRPRWHHPVLLLRTENSWQTGSAACIGPVTDGPLPVR
jgi:hypothetical protein